MYCEKVSDLSETLQWAAEEAIFSAVESGEAYVVVVFQSLVGVLPKKEFWGFHDRAYSKLFFMALPYLSTPYSISYDYLTKRHGEDKPV